MGLFVAAVPELVEENRKNKEREKKDGEKRTEVVVEEVEKGGDESGRETERGKELMFTLHRECRLLLPIFCERLCATA